MIDGLQERYYNHKALLNGASSRDGPGNYSEPHEYPRICMYIAPPIPTIPL